MRRRGFLAAAAGLVAGCRRDAVAPPPEPVTSAADLSRIAAERDERKRHLALIERFRVPATATRTTSKPAADVLAAAPELKTRQRVAVRLHPRFGDEPAADESKLGGRFLWPAAEPWPACGEHHLPLVPVLQLRLDDAPPQVPFPPGTDLLQLLWCPRDHGPGGPRPQVVWRTRGDVTGPPVVLPANDLAFPGYVPVPCRLFPERVTEFPPTDALPQIASTREALAKLPRYDELLAAADGTKVGGYPRWAKPAVPSCPACKWGMDYLLTVASAEWNEASRERWKPAEDADDDGFRRACGLTTGKVLVFVCRRCEGWPVAGVKVPA